MANDKSNDDSMEMLKANLLAQALIEVLKEDQAETEKQMVMATYMPIKETAKMTPLWVVLPKEMVVSQKRLEELGELGESVMLEKETLQIMETQVWGQTVDEMVEKLEKEAKETRNYQKHLEAESLKRQEERIMEVYALSEVDALEGGEESEEPLMTEDALWEVMTLHIVER